MTVSGELSALRALERQMRGAQHADARKLSAWSAQLAHCIRGLDLSTRLLREGAAEPPSEALPPSEGGVRLLTPADAPGRGKRRRGARQTSVDAADLVAPRTGSQRARVLDAVHSVSTGPLGGLTDVELARQTGLSANSVRPRRVELVDLGWLEDTGRTRAHLGRAHAVWGLTESAVRALSTPA